MHLYQKTFQWEKSITFKFCLHLTFSEIFLTENLLFHLQQLKFQEFCGKWKIPLTSVSFPKSMPLQRAKKVLSDSPGLVDFAIGLVIFVLNLPDG